MRVEISDDRFSLIPGYSGPDSGAAADSEGLDCAVTWPAGSLDALGGKEVRFRVRLTRQGEAAPKLYALYLNDA